MRQSPISSSAGADYSQSQEGEYAPPHTIDFRHILTAVRRQGLLFGAIVSAALLLGVIFLLEVRPLYTADAFVLIDNRRVRAVDSGYDLGSANSDVATSIVDSQVEVARAEKISQRVIESLGLLNDPDFKDMLSSGKGTFARLRQSLMVLLGRQPAAPNRTGGRCE